MKDGFQATRETINALEKLDIPYMLVGGLSSMTYGIPRSRDILAVQGDDALDWEYIHRWTAKHKTRELPDEIRASIPPID